MKKTFIIAILVFITSLASAENFLSGEVIVTNPGQLAISLNHEFPLGTKGSFSYDGKSLSMSIGGKIFKDVSISCGVGFKPNGEKCYYVSLQDGIEMGAIQASGTGTYYGQSIKVSANPSYKLNFCPHWIPNTQFVLKPSIAGAQRMLVRPKVKSSSIPQLLYDVKGEAQTKYALQMKEDETIEAYCIEHKNKVPSTDVTFSMDHSVSIDPAIFSIDEEDPLLNQINVYSFVIGNEVTADSIVAVITGENAALLLIKNGIPMGNIVKYANGEFQSGRHISIEHLKRVLNMEQILRNKKPNRIYLSENVDPMTREVTKQLFVASGCTPQEDGSLSCPPELSDLDKLYEFYSKLITPAMTAEIESLMQMMQY